MIGSSELNCPFLYGSSGNEYLFAKIIIQLSIKFPLLAAWYTSFACPKDVWRKRHPTMPALRAPLCCSPVAGRQKLADAQTGLTSCSTTCSAARQHRMGNSMHAHTCPGRRYPDDPYFFILLYYSPISGGYSLPPDNHSAIVRWALINSKVF